MSLPNCAHGSGTPSAWMQNALHGIAPCWQGGVQAPAALDLACGQGRHTRLLLASGYRVTAVDRDATALAACPAEAERLQLDLEGAQWPLAGRQFDVVLVCHYLWRPRWDDLVQSVAPGGYLLYETFMAGHEAFGSPRNPDFLLQPGELLHRCQPGFEILRFEQGVRQVPGPALVQRVLARRVVAGSPLALQSAHTLTV